MQFPEFLTRLPDGEIVLTGHRIGLSHLVDRYNEGESAEMLASRYPTLSLPLVHKVLAFYLENAADVDAYVGNCSAGMERQRDASGTVDVDALRKRLSGRDATVSKVQVG